MMRLTSPLFFFTFIYTGEIALYFPRKSRKLSGITPDLFATDQPALEMRDAWNKCCLCPPGFILPVQGFEQETLHSQLVSPTLSLPLPYQ